MTNQLIETICIDCNHEGNEDSKCVMTHLKFKGGTTMKGKYSMMLVIFVTLGCYYMFGLNHKLDVWLEDFINTQSWLQYISINVLFMIMMVPFIYISGVRCNKSIISILCLCKKKINQILIWKI